jgi:hypothetical protein
MAFSLDVDPGRGLVLLRPDAQPSLQDWVDAIDRALSHPDFQTGFSFVSDRRHITDPPSKDYVRGSIEALVARRERLGAGCRVAVVTSHDAPFGMARMAEAYAEPRAVTFRVFRDYDEAITWVTGREDE